MFQKIRRRLTIFQVIPLAIMFSIEGQETNPVIQLDTSLNEIVPQNAKVEKVADHLGFIEGPVWVRKGGFLLFSDFSTETINKWDPRDGKVSVFLERSGFTGEDPKSAGIQEEGHNSILGSNGVTLDQQGRVVYCARGDRQIVRLEKNGRRTVLAKEYQGNRLNRPNDLVYRSDGALYFTDPAILNESDSVSRVFMLKNGILKLLPTDIPFPNGLAFTPDEKHLYIVNARDIKTIMLFDLRADGTIENGRVFIDMKGEDAPGGPDGMKVDEKGNVYASGPGGLWIMSATGKHLGTILVPELVTNLAFGDPDGKTLYLTAHTGLYRIRLRIAGIRP